MYICGKKSIVRKRGRGREFVQTGLRDGHLMYPCMYGRIISISYFHVGRRRRRAEFLAFGMEFVSFSPSFFSF